MAHFCVDCQLRFKLTIKDPDSGQLVDPTTLQLEIAPPKGTATLRVYGTDSELVKDSLGTYHCDHVMAGAAGEWTYKWKSTGSGAGAHKGTVFIEP
jgi:hypothetical protein